MATRIRPGRPLAEELTRRAPARGLPRIDKGGRRRIVKRVTVIVEGPTEERFVTDVLAPELLPASVSLTPIVLGVPGHRGGRVNYARVRKDIVRYLKSDPTAYCTTLFDYYGLGAGFPSPPPNLTNSAKATRIEATLKADIVAELDHLRADQRFIPYLQVHEYEALLFSDPNALAAAIRIPNLTAQLTAIRRQFETPEDINDDPHTARGGCPTFR